MVFRSVSVAPPDKWNVHTENLYGAKILGKSHAHWRIKQKASWINVSQKTTLTLKPAYYVIF